MSKPTSLPIWATDGGAAITEPLLAEKEIGWTSSQKPPAQWFNWWQKTVYLWMVWLDAFESTVHTWTAAQTFSSAVTFSNDLIANGDAFFAGATELAGAITTGSLASNTADEVAMLLDDNTPTDARRLVGSFVATAAGARVRYYSRKAAFSGLEITYNAAWNEGASRWDRDVAATTSRRLIVGDATFAAARNSAGGANFVEGAWLTEFDTDPGNSVDLSAELDASALGGVLIDDGTGAIGRTQSLRYQSSSTGIPLPVETNIDTLNSDYQRNFLGETVVSGTAVANTTITSGTKIAQLPVGYRPKIERYFPILLTSTPTAEVWLRVQTNGRIDLMANGWSPAAGFQVIFDQIRFDADF